MENSANTGPDRVQQAVLEAREHFVKELRPASDIKKGALAFRKTLVDYNTTLNQVAHAADSGLVNISIDLIRSQHQLQQTDLTPERQATLQQDLDHKTQQIYGWVSENVGGMTEVLKNSVPSADQKQQVVALIAENTAYWVAMNSTTGKVNKAQIGNEQLLKMARFLFENAPEYKKLTSKINTGTPDDSLSDPDQLSLDKNSWPENQEILDVLVAEVIKDEQIAKLDPKVALFETKHWLAQTAKEARKGIKTPEGTRKRKIFQTPYYSDLLTKLDRIGRKKNGVGGVIVFGPPGTGKTELIQEHNRQQGYETHVVNIHHYTSFADLLAERSISLRSDQSAPVAQKLDVVLSQMKQLSPERFGSAMQDIYLQLQANGKIAETQNMSQMLLGFLNAKNPELITVLAKPNFDTADWEKIQQAFLAKQEARLLQTALPEYLQDNPEDIVRGELLLAIKRSKGTGKKVKVLLDEIDKGGPNTYGGLLTFLAKSPGETITIGDVTETIPEWFGVDATSNSMDLNEYLSDRFSHMEIHTPPVKDQLMIAGVLLSDDEGNIKLNPYEQEQVVGLLTYLVPEINAGLEAADQPPLSNRSLQELCSILVDYGNMERTDVSVRTAIKSIVLSGKVWAGDDQVKQFLEGSLDKFKYLLADKPHSIRWRSHVTQTSPVADLEDRYQANLHEVAHSPLIRAIEATPASESEADTGGQDLIEVILDDKQQLAVAKFFQNVASPGLMDSLKLDNDLIWAIQGGQFLNLYAVRAGEKAHPLHQTSAPNGLIHQASSIGDVLLFIDKKNDGKQTVSIKEPFDTSGKVESKSDFGEGEVQMDKRGDFVIHLGTNNLLEVAKTGDLTSRIKLEGVKQANISANGKLLLVERSNGTTQLLSTETLTNYLDAPLGELTGFSWKFIGDNLLALISEDKNQVSATAFYIG